MLSEIESFDVIEKQLVKLVLVEGAVKIVEVGMIFKVVLTDPVKYMVDIVCINCILQYIDE